MLYLDNSATTQIHPEVFDAMLPYLKEEYGNPSSKYYSLSENAKNATETARDQIANLLCCRTDEVIFTSGATESNNMIIKGIYDHYHSRGNHIITTSTEHPSVLETIKYLVSKGCSATYLEVDLFGRINIDQLNQMVLTNNPLLVSTIWGNNEIGSLNDIELIGKICADNKVFFHSDATQAFGKINIDLSQLNINFLSCSAHKIHGPKGIGACIIKKRLGTKTKLTPLLHGGGQENEYRSGTLSVHNIVGFGKAAEIAKKKLFTNIEKIRKLEQLLVKELESHFSEQIVFNNDKVNKISGIISVRFKGVNNELLIKKIASSAAVSTGSACSSAKPSHVLTSIGLSTEEIRETIRISLSSLNTEEDVYKFIKLLLS